MKAVILAGGKGTRLAEETHAIPKPMVTIGGKPILWHIMKHFSHFGVREFVICLGYKGYVIKDYFANYRLHQAEAVTINTAQGAWQHRVSMREDWSVTLVETGLETQTGGRLGQISKYMYPDQIFFLTYGDGLSDVDLSALLKTHDRSGPDTQVTVTATRPPGRWGLLDLELAEPHRPTLVRGFREHGAVEGGGGRINAGFFVVRPETIRGLTDISWETDVLPLLIETGSLAAHRHDGFWQAMDTIRDREVLENLWASGKAPWKVWSE